MILLLLIHKKLSTNIVHRILAISTTPTKPLTTAYFANRYVGDSHNNTDWPVEAENRLILSLVQTQNPASLCRSNIPSIPIRSLRFNHSNDI